MNNLDSIRVKTASYQKMGDVLAKEGRVDEAIAAYQEAVQLQPDAEIYFQLGSLLTLSGRINEAIAAYQQAVQLQPDYVEVYWNLAWLFSQQEQWAEAISYYQKACEIKPCSNEEHFQLTSKYTFINLYSLSDSDNIYLETVGISLANIELIEQDNATWKKMYSAEDWSQLLIFMPEFQQRILETGHIDLFCPKSGKILNSNQSFYLGLDYNITLYRFSGVEIFYLIVGCSHTLKLGIYIPSHELIISFCDPRYSFWATSSKARFESWINTFKYHTISCLDKVKNYISNNEPKHVTAALGFLPNLGHYFMNELSAFQELHKKHLLINKLNSFLIGPYNYFDIREVFPEITKENSIISVFQIQQKQYSRLAFETCLTYNLLAVTLTNFIIQEQLANRLYHCSFIKCQESFLQKVGESKKYFPLICITLRSHRRSWLQQIEGIANIVNELFKDYQNLAIIFDGMSSENNNLDKIKALIHPSIKTYNALECNLHETIVWMYSIDTFIAPFGAGSIFTSIANKPGVFHTNTGFCRPKPFCINPRENCVLDSSVPIDSVIDSFDSNYNVPNDRNYYVEWKVIYNEVIKIIESLKLERQKKVLPNLICNINLNQKDLMDEAIAYFPQASSRQLTEGEIYEQLWKGLNQLSPLAEKNLSYQTEINGENAIKYFSKKNQYKVIEIWSVTDEEKEFIREVGLSPDYLAVMYEQRGISLEEVYINSFGSAPKIKSEDTIKKGIKSKKDSFYHSYPGNGINYGYIEDYDSACTYQQGMVNTGYIYSLCPATGQIIRSNQSFNLLGWNGTLHIYRFVSTEVFYCLVGVHSGIRVAMYFPKSELIILYHPIPSTPEPIQDAIDNLKAYTVSCWSTVLSYISTNDLPKKRVNLAGFVQNLGHYFWNDLSGIQNMYENGTLNKIDSFLIGNYNFFDLCEVFPEIPAEKIVRLNDDNNSALTWFKYIIDNQYFAFMLADQVVQETLAQRLYRASFKRCSEETFLQVQESHKKFPVLLFAIRCNYRIWSSQVEGIANIIKSLHSDFPNLGVVFAGNWYLTEQDYQSEAGDFPVPAIEKATMEKILELIPPDICVSPTLINKSYEAILWANTVDICIFPFGTGVALFHTVCNKLSVCYGPRRYVNDWFIDHMVKIRENAVTPIVVGSEVDTANPFVDNYDIDWKAIYNEVVKIIEKLKEERMLTS